MYQARKKNGGGQQGAAIESLSAVKEKQIISALFHAGLHIVSTSGLLYFFFSSSSHFSLRIDYTLMRMLQLARIKTNTRLPAEPPGSGQPFINAGC